MTRRLFLNRAIGLSAVAGCFATDAQAICTPSPRFPVPLTEGVWRSQEFPVGRHNYRIELLVDRRMPLEELDRDLSKLDLEWRIWDGPTLVQTGMSLNPTGWGPQTSFCSLGGFQGKRKGHFTLELVVKKDAGRLKDLNPRVHITKSPGYWCWL